MNREAWLNRVAYMLRPWFRDHGYPIYGQMSVGMALMSPRAQGLCIKNKAQGNTMKHIFVSAYEDGIMSDPVEVAATLVHEILHAVLPFKSGHGKIWQEGAVKLGLELSKIAKPGEADTAGPALRAHLTELVAALPPLPRYGVTRPVKAYKPVVHKPGGSFRFQCDDCKLTLAIKYTSLEKAGAPSCWNEECGGYGEPMEEIM